jgi:hypothetical protein
MVTLVFALALGFVAGCAEEEFVPGEPKRIDDTLTQEDVDKFLEVLDRLPEKKAPEFPRAFPPPPTWNSNRSLPVQELLVEAEKEFSERESLEWMSSRCAQSRALKRALRRHRLSNEEFTGLYLAIGVALSREMLPPGRDPEQLVAQGRKVLDDLKKDGRVYSTLREDAAFLVTEQAAWMAVVQRCSWLKRVPAGNLALVRENRERLQQRFSEEFLRNPLDDFARIIDDQGVPFHETPGGESDDRLPWHRDHAILGIDNTGESTPVTTPGIKDAVP